MIEALPQLFAHSNLLVLFGLILAGYVVGTWSVRGISFGPGGIFLVALFFGHAGFSLPKEIMDIGLVLFVYTIGIQVGPRFVRMFKRDGIKFASVACSMVTAAAVCTWGIARLLRLPPDIAAGIFSGAITNTPAMAAAADMITTLGIGDRANVTAGYAISYPFAIIVAVLFVQLLPGILRRNPHSEEEEWLAHERAATAGLIRKQFTVENQNCLNISVDDVRLHHSAPFTISRIRRGEQEFAAKPSMLLSKGDVVTVVGTQEALQTCALVFGPETNTSVSTEYVYSDDVEVLSSTFAGKRIKDLDIWHEYEVTITRVRRQDFEIAPYGETLLEEGDVLRVVGERDDVARFIKAVGVRDDHLHQTHFAPFLLGIVFGLLLGVVPVPFIPGPPIVLGSAGGALIAGLLFSHIKRFGSFEHHVPQAAIVIVRELGLMLFLAGAGLIAGARFMGVFERYGITLFVAGAGITVATLVAGVLTMRAFRFNILSITASLSAGMTQPAVLAAARAQGNTDLVTLVYASVYPFAMIGKIIIVQVLVYALHLSVG
jgi:putative transport protein